MRHFHGRACHARHGLLRSGRTAAGVGEIQQILAIAGLSQFRSQGPDSVPVDETHLKGDFLRTTHFQTLACRHRTDELAGLEQGIVRSGIEPCMPAAKDFDHQLVAFQIEIIKCRDLQLAARGRL